MLIKEKLNFKTLSNNLIDKKFLQIQDFLSNDFAQKIHICLKDKVNWGLACRIDNKPITFEKCKTFNEIPKKYRKKFKKQIKQPFQFLYGTYMMVTAYKEKRDPDLYLNHVLEWLNSTETLNYFKELIQDDSIIKINAQATRYTSKNFLTQHNDESIEEGRLYAYVLGLTKDWNPDWGGLLNIIDEEGNITATLLPKYNTLSIFKVPQNHFVSYVTPDTTKERISITGWLLSK